MLVGDLEECLTLQLWLYELLNPGVSAWELIELDPSVLAPITLITDCRDLAESLSSPAAPFPTGKSLAIYQIAVREETDDGRVQHIV